MIFAKLVSMGLIVAAVQTVCLASDESRKLKPNCPPSSNFDLHCWNLTLPEGNQGKPSIISTESLLRGYTSKYLNTSSEDGALVFWCPVTGVTTKNSHYPRTELRETNSDGSGALYNWHIADGTSVLTAMAAVTQVPSTGKVIIGQIHDDGSGGVPTKPLLKLVYSQSSQTVCAEVRTDPAADNQDTYVLARKVNLGDRISYVVQSAPNHRLSIQVNGVTKEVSLASSWDQQGLYFKAGAYCQDNLGPATEAAMVNFFALSIRHTKVSANNAVINGPID